MQGTLVVEDGTTAEGVFFGSNKRVVGELVFNTNMTGYTEALTDPSYRGQVRVMTYPLIGNYGVDPASMESGEIQVTGFVVKEACPVPVNPKATMGVDRFLQEQGRPGLSGVDTRMLTIKTRTRGTMRAALVPEGGDVEGAMEEVRTMPFPDSRNLVAECSTRDAVEYPGPESRTFVVIDCGVKMNIIRETQRLGRVVQLPYDATPEDIARHRPDGVIISNGPGNPAHPDILATSVKAAKEIATEYPILGICLGHQILGLAFGGTTYKLKFGPPGGPLVPGGGAPHGPRELDPRHDPDGRGDGGRRVHRAPDGRILGEDHREGTTGRNPQRNGRADGAEPELRTRGDRDPQEV